MLPRRAPSRGPSLWSERCFAKAHGVEISCSASLRRASVRSRLARALHRPAGHDPLAPRSGALSILLIKPCSAAIGVSGLRDVLRLIQPDASLESTMQRDMQCDVTCCTVTFSEQFSILMAEEVHELLSPCVRKRPHP